MTPFTIISYYTEGTDYETEAMELATTCDAHGLAYDIRAVPNLGSWQRNTQYKARFIRAALDEHDTPIVWVDADARIRQLPQLFLQWETPGFAAHWRNGKELLSGTLWLTRDAVPLVDLWIDRNKAFPNAWDQQNLQYVVENNPGICKIERLPATYCQIFDLMKNAGEPVILHTQASRRLKFQINTPPCRFSATRRQAARPHGPDITPEKTLEDIKNLVAGKSVVIVGNSESLVGAGRGGFIDSHDVVVRFNAGVPEGREADMGSKHHIWVFNATRAPMAHQVKAMKWFHPRSEIVIWISPGHRLDAYIGFMASLGPKDYRQPLFEYQQFCEAHGFFHTIPERCSRLWKGRQMSPKYRAQNCPAPSAGVQAIDLLVNRVGTQSGTTVVGFDGFSNRTYYNPRNYITPHSRTLERAFLSKISEKVRIV